MKPSGPVIVDTSVHLSSEVFGRAGSPAKEVLARGFAGHFDSALSAALLNELACKLIECGAPASDVADYLAKVRAASIMFDDADACELTCADPDDLFLLVLGRTSAAWCIVAQDGVLRDAATVPPGWSPGFFLARLRETRGELEGQRFP